MTDQAGDRPTSPVTSKASRPPGGPQAGLPGWGGARGPQAGLPGWGEASWAAPHAKVFGTLLAGLVLLAAPAGAGAQDGGAPEKAAAAAAGEPRKVTPDEAVAIALRDSGQILEAQGKLQEWVGRLAEVQSVFYPKLTGMGYVAPMFRVRNSPDLRAAPDVDRDFSEWGPYLHLQAVLAQPLYTFGRVAAGERAAKGRVEVERARVAQARNVLAFEVRKLYYLHLFAHSMRPALENARDILDKAQSKAKEEYEDNTGKVTNVDIQRLSFASSELDKFRIQAEIGEDLALAAMKHTMGLPQNAPIVAADEMLPDPPENLPALAALLRKASENRPEWTQIKQGKEAALSLEQAEKLANAPVVFLGGQFYADWTPMRPDIKNPYYWDPYNQVFGGVALGLLFDLDPVKAAAKAQQARALQTQVEGLERFAKTGIPMEVRKAHDEAVQAKRIAAVAEEGSTAARKWMIFSGAAFATGTGEAKDVLEGLAAYLQAKKGHYEALQNMQIALAQLLYVTGETGAKP
jgi:outer membrane protein TolC